MAKETVRYPDELVAQIEAVVDRSSAFESKSEYHRFASEFLLTLLDPEHSPSVLGYTDILAELDVELPDPEAGAVAGDADETVDFLEAYVRVRRHLLRGETEAAAAYVDDAYAVTDREALLLEEVVARHTEGPVESSSERAERPPRGADGTPATEPNEPGDASGDTAAEARQEPAGISARAVSDDREADSAEERATESADSEERDPREFDRSLRPAELEVSDARMD